MYQEVFLVCILSSIGAQRYTHPFLGQQNTYEVNEGPRNFFQSGNSLRFSLNPKLGDPMGFLNGGHFRSSIFEPSSFSFGGDDRGNFYRPQHFPSHFYGGFHRQPLGYSQKNFYNDQDRKVADSVYKHQQAQQGIEGEAGVKKLNEDVQQREEKEEKSGAFTSEESNKKVLEDSKKYDGQKLHEKEGSNENEQKNKSSHKKGHVIKHFKNSHHKDETGRDEQYYDEEHDEGGTFKYDSTKGKFGETESSQQKEKQENKELESNERAQKGGHENSEFSGQNLGHSEQFKEEKKLLDASEHGKGNLHKDESILGHQESEKVLLNQPLHDNFDKDT